MNGREKQAKENGGCWEETPLWKEERKGKKVSF